MTIDTAAPKGQSAAEHADAIIASARGSLPERVLALIGRAAIAGLLPARPGEPSSATADDHVTSVTWSCGPLRLHVSQDVGDDTLHAVCYDGGHAVMTGERAADVYSARVASLVAYRGGR